MSLDNLVKLSTNRKIIVGIDFGTTFSGVAWAEIRRYHADWARSGPIDTITEWPISETRHGGESSIKVPTTLRYTESGWVEWGLSIPLTAPVEEIVAWFKMYSSPSSSVENVYLHHVIGLFASYGGLFPR